VRGAVAVVAAYLLGSISFSYYVVRWLRGRDVRSLGSGNPGATNVLRTTGKGAGITVLLLDVAKGMAAVALAQAVEAPQGAVYGAAAAAVAGHAFPVFLGFRGGKGVATGSGVMLLLAPLPTAFAALLFAAVVAATRYVALGSVAAALACAPLAYLCGRLGWTEPAAPGLLTTAAGIGALIAVRHGGNLRRLRAGTEGRLGDDVRGEGGDE
jgi:acyl phosphate:glycerol-3-phosphate acyltransferase